MSLQAKAMRDLDEKIERITAELGMAQAALSEARTKLTTLEQAATAAKTKAPLLSFR